MKALSFVATLVLAAAVVTRFPPVLARLPWEFVVFAVAGAALGLAGVAESRLPRGAVGPLWMRVSFAPRLALAVALSFCTTVIAQKLQVDFGPVDVNFPADAPLGMNAFWFFMFTLGFSGIGMMSAPSILLPVLGPIASSTKKLPLPAAAAIVAVLGAAVGIGFARVLVLAPVVRAIDAGRTWVDANEQLVFAVTLALTVGPALLPSKGDD